MKTKLIDYETEESGKPSCGSAQPDQSCHLKRQFWVQLKRPAEASNQAINREPSSYRKVVINLVKLAAALLLLGLYNQLLLYQIDAVSIFASLIPLDWQQLKSIAS